MEMERDNNFNGAQAVYNGENAKNMGKKILKPIVQEKIVKVPVTQYVEKIIEKEEIKYVNKYVDVIKPVITYKTKHIMKPIYLDKIKYETKVLEKEKIIHIPKIEYKNKIVEVPVYVHREKIIEKKVPLIIERVIPVLKVRTSEKNVLADTIAMPDICDMSDKDRFNKHLKIVTEQFDNSNRMSMNRMSFISNMRSNEIDASNMKTYRMNLESVKEQTADFNNSYKIEKNINSDISSSASNANRDEELNADMNAPVKHDTIYQEETNEESIEGEQSNLHHEEINISVNASESFCEKKEHIMNEEQFYNIDNNSEFNTTRVSVHLPEHLNVRTTEGYEQINSGNESQYNESMNNIMNLNNSVFNDNESTFLGKNLKADKSVSEQAFKINTTQIDQKIYSFPVQGNYHENLQEVAKEQAEMQQNFAKMNVTMTPSREQYNSMHTVQTERINFTPSKQNFRPSYANSNGQAVVSVRPATIVEYKPKNKKSRAPMCNFLNNCCRGNQD